MFGLYKYLKQFKFRKLKEVIIFFLLATIVMTLIEYTGGIFIKLCIKYFGTIVT